MPGPTFRIFVSSTFADLVREREALRSHVFPKLEALCRARGAAFQAVDLRWGISDDAAREQRTVAFCREEVAGSLRISSPPMIVLLGDRYGWRPVPDPIAATTFDALCAHVSSAAAGELRAW